MTPLETILLAQIAHDGPMSIADYMTACLHHPKHGYYSTRDPLGQTGDFITAPEISQMFGELLGLALAQSWMDQGMPRAFVLAELGPGRGTLMADALRATKAVPGFHAALDLWLVETSPTLRDIQRQTLAPQRVRHVASVADLPDAPLFLIANEFFDALPIRSYQRNDTGWDEWRVGAQGDRLAIGLQPAGDVPALAPRLADTTPGQVVEICPPAEAIGAELGRRIAQQGGTALIIDYGDPISTTATFQAVHRHQKVDPLHAPGEADLTAHLAFAPLLAAARPAQAVGPVPQGAFLGQLGLHARADILARGLSGPALLTHRAAQKRLTDPSEMGSLFKVAALVPEGAPEPPGFAPT